MNLIFLALGACLLVPISLLPGDWMGWILLYTTFAVIPFFLSFRDHRNTILAIWATLIARHIVAIVNAYSGPIIGATDDALNFHLSAMLSSRLGGIHFGLGSQFYSSMLALGYSFFGTSLLFGEETSVLAYALSCVVLIKLLELLKIDRHRVLCVLCFGLLPASVLFGSFTMRESWEILFFMCAVHSLLLFRFRGEPTALLLGVLSTALMGLLHNGLMAYALFLLSYSLFSRLGPRSGLSLQRLIGLALAGAIMTTLVVAVLTHSIPQAPTIEHMMEGDALEYAAKYRQRGMKGARAEYGVKLDTSSPGMFAGSVSLLYVYYMLSPFPWQISTGLDVFAALDAWFRLLLLFFCIGVWWFHPRGVFADARRFLLVLYFVMSLLWAMGTINYGTGIRHHIVPVWILVILGVPPLIDGALFLSGFRGGEEREEAGA